MAQGKSRNRELEAKWEQALAGQRQSGVTVREFCRVHGLKESAFHYWKRELKRREGGRQSSVGRGKRARQAAPALVPVTLAGGPPVPIEISLAGGVTLRVASGCPESLLRMVVAILGAS